MKKRIIILLFLYTLLAGAGAFADDKMASIGRGYLYTNNWLYRFAYEDGEYQLTRSREDGTNARRISCGYALDDTICVVGDTVFILGAENMPSGDLRCRVWAVNVDDGNKLAISEPQNIFRFFASDTHIYVETNDSRIIRYRIDPWDEVNRIDIPANAYNFQIANGWLYYQILGSPTIFRVRTEGGESEAFLSLAAEGELSGMTVEDGNMYYCLMDKAETSSSIIRVQLENGERQLVASGAWEIDRLANGWAYGWHISLADQSIPGLSQSVDYDAPFAINLKTAAIYELDSDKWLHNAFMADEYMIYDVFDESAPPIFLEYKNIAKRFQFNIHAEGQSASFALSSFMQDYVPFDARILAYSPNGDDHGPMSYGLIKEDYDIHNTDETLNLYESVVEVITLLELTQPDKSVNAPLEEQWHFAVQLFMRSEADDNGADLRRDIQLDFFDRYNPIRLRIADVDESGASSVVYDELCLIDSSSVTALEAAYLKRVCSLKRLDRSVDMK